MSGHPEICFSKQRKIHILQGGQICILHHLHAYVAICRFFFGCKDKCVFWKYLTQIHFILNPISLREMVLCWKNICLSAFFGNMPTSSTYFIIICFFFWIVTCFYILHCNAFQIYFEEFGWFWVNVDCCVHLRFAGWEHIQWNLFWFFYYMIVYFILWSMSKCILYSWVYGSIFCPRRPFSNRSKHKSSKSCHQPQYAIQNTTIRNTTICNT